MTTDLHREAPRSASETSSIEADLQYLEHCFSNDRSNFRAVINECFARQENVYNYALDLVNHSNFFRNSLPYHVMKVLKEWCIKNDMLKHLTLTLKEKAVKTALEHNNRDFIKLICDIFQVKNNYNYFKSHIRSLLKEKKFREAFCLISYLNAENDFTLEEFAFPVFILGNAKWVASYLDKAGGLKIEKFVQAIDSICLSSLHIRAFIRELPYNLPLPKKTCNNMIHLQKLFSKCIDDLGIDIKKCKNLYFIHRFKAMTFVIGKRYADKTISEESFEEMIKLIVKDDKILQKIVLKRVVKVEDYSVSLQLARDFSFNKNDWPQSLRNAYENNGNLDDTCTDENSSDTLSLNTLSLHRHNIIIVDTPDRLIKAVNHIVQNYDLIGFDAEWRPLLGITKESVKLAVLQIAVWKKVYLIDVINLQKYPDQKFWQHLYAKIFNNENITKLGFESNNDLQLVLQLCSRRKHEIWKLPCNFDISGFCKKLAIDYPEVIEDIDRSHSHHSSRGLSQLCSKLLGKPLNKLEQFSDWENRPLRENQIIYAALDAYCLLLIYKKLGSILEKFHLSFDDVMKKGIATSPSKNNNEISKRCDFCPIHITEFRVVCDNMLFGLSKYLKECGADVISLRREEDYMEAVKIVQSEDRIILSTGISYEKLLQTVVDKNLVHYIDKTLSKQEQFLEILQHYNVQCECEDIFSTCLICSGKNFMKVPKDELYNLWSSLGNTISTDRNTVDKRNRTFPAVEQFVTKEGKLELGVAIQTSALTENVFETAEMFFICVECGEVYWEALHLTHTKDHGDNLDQGAAAKNEDELTPATHPIVVPSTSSNHKHLSRN